MFGGLLLHIDLLILIHKKYLLMNSQHLLVIYVYVIVNNLFNEKIYVGFLLYIKFT